MSENTIQEEFLSKVQGQEIPVTLFLMNGFQMRGTISGFDDYSVFLHSDGKENQIYKHAISTVQPHHPVLLNS